MLNEIHISSIGDETKTVKIGVWVCKLTTIKDDCRKFKYVAKINVYVDKVWKKITLCGGGMEYPHMTEHRFCLLAEQYMINKICKKLPVSSCPEDETTKLININPLMGKFLKGRAEAQQRKKTKGIATPTEPACLLAL